MCHYANATELQKILKSGKKTFTVYKILKFVKQKFTDRINNITIDSKHYHHTWMPGINTSDTKDTYLINLTHQTSDIIYNGFHTYRNINVANSKSKPGGIVVKFKARLEDIVAANSEQIVFNQLYLEPEEYIRVLKEIKKKR